MGKCSWKGQHISSSHKKFAANLTMHLRQKLQSQVALQRRCSAKYTDCLLPYSQSADHQGIAEIEGRYSAAAAYGEFSFFLLLTFFRLRMLSMCCLFLFMLFYLNTSELSPSLLCVIAGGCDRRAGGAEHVRFHLS